MINLEELEQKIIEHEAETGKYDHRVDYYFEWGGKFPSSNELCKSRAKLIRYIKKIVNEERK